MHFNIFCQNRNKHKGVKFYRKIHHLWAVSFPHPDSSELQPEVNERAVSLRTPRVKLGSVRPIFNCLCKQHCFSAPIPAEESGRCHRDRLIPTPLPSHTWLRQTPVEGQMVCVTLVSLLCCCYLYATEAAAAAAVVRRRQAPKTKAFVSELEKERGRGMSRRQKQMFLLGYHLSPSGRTRSSCLVCELCWRGCAAPTAGNRKQQSDISISPVLARERSHGSF